MTRSMSATYRTFSQVYAGVLPGPDATVLARIMAPGVRSLRTFPPARWEMNCSIIATAA